MANKSYIYIGVSLIAVVGVTTYLQNIDALDVIDANNAELVAQGNSLYTDHCASCHGGNLEGESQDWRSFKEDGTLPAPPHDASGHTWHHDDQLLFDYIKLGGAALAPEGFKSAMPAFKDTLTDLQVRAVLSYIKSQWPKDIQKKQLMRNNAKP